MPARSRAENTSSNPHAASRARQCRGLVVAVLEDEPAAGLEMTRRLRDDFLDAFVAGRARDQRLARLEAHVALVEMTIVRGHVRRIGDDDVEAAAGRAPANQSLSINSSATP